MDPYLETRWSDVHVTMIGFIKEALQPLLPADLRARSEENLLFEEAGSEDDVEYRGDVAIVRTGRTSGAATALSPLGTIEPVIVERRDGPVFDRFVKIIDRTRGNRVITVVEVLSPGNKAPGRLNEQYRRKLDDYRRAGVSVVEIDLLRYPGRNRLPVGQVDLPDHRRAPYLTCVRRGRDPDRWIIYPMQLREPLGVIPIPLRERDPEISLDLQAQIQRVYVAGGHDDINYSKPCDPPLEGEDAAWADQLLKASGFRK